MLVSVQVTARQMFVIVSMFKMSVLVEGMSMLSAVSQQRQTFDQLTWGFVRRLSTHLSGLFVKQVGNVLY